MFGPRDMRLFKALSKLLEYSCAAPQFQISFACAILNSIRQRSMVPSQNTFIIRLNEPDRNIFDRIEPHIYLSRIWEEKEVHVNNLIVRGTEMTEYVSDFWPADKQFRFLFSFHIDSIYWQKIHYYELFLFGFCGTRHDTRDRYAIIIILATSSPRLEVVATNKCCVGKHGYHYSLSHTN